jgi:HlyD family secretion protein
MTDSRDTPGPATVSGNPPMADPAPAKLPVALPPPPLRRRHRGRRPIAVLLLLIVAGGLGGAYWWLQSRSALPPGFAFGNGRLEADEIDIETKFAGRIAERFADEGDMVRAGQALARMDTRDLEATLKRAEAQVMQAQRTIDQARSDLAQQQTQVTLAHQQLDRTTTLVRQGYATQELLDQRRQQMDGALAAQSSAQARLNVATHALEAAQHDAELYRVNIADNLLVAPSDGRIQYRLATIGEVLPAGGKVFTMLDTAVVYMEIYLPTAEAGRVRLGAEARIVLDALPNRPIPAKVSFLANQAQFTPKPVETRSERDKLMFRVKVRVDPDLLHAHADAVRTGLPGIAYVRLDPAVPWPAALEAWTPR